MLDKMIAVLKEMDNIVRNFDDENLIMRWLVNGVPDGAVEEDFIEIALDDELFLDTLELFKKLYSENCEEK